MELKKTRCTAEETISNPNVSSVQKCIECTFRTVDKENKENQGVTSHQSTPERGPICIFGQEIVPVGSAFKPSGWIISREEVNGESDQSQVQPVSPLGVGLYTPGADDKEDV